MTGTAGRRLTEGLLACIATMTCAAGAPALAAGAAFVRVDQLGYVPTAPKTAYVISSVAEGSSGAYDVIDSAGHAVTGLHGSLPSTTDSWNPAYPYVYRLDLSALHTAGNYHVHVTGAAPADSPPFAIAAPGALYAQPLHAALSFFQAQRDGPDVIPGVLGRGPSHTLDASAYVYPPRYDSSGNVDDGSPMTTPPARIPGTATVDLSGGWLDAGDDLKFTGNEAYADLVLLLAMHSYPTAFATGANDLTAEAKFGTDYLLKTWDDQTRTLYYQVGLMSGQDGAVYPNPILGDHSVWMAPEAADLLTKSDGTALTRTDTSDPSYFLKFRPAYRAAPPGSPLDPVTAGRLAAALALCSRVFRISDEAYANRCLVEAQHVYQLAKTDPPPGQLATGGLDTYQDQNGVTHPDFADDMELGAVELALATAQAPALPGLSHSDPTYYLNDPARGAVHWAAQTNDGTTYNPLSFDNVSALANDELIAALRHFGLSSASEEQKLVATIQGQLDTAVGFATGQIFTPVASREPFALGVPYDNGVAYSIPGLVVTAEMYHDLTGSTTYDAFAQQQLDYLFGANPWGTTFMVGVGSTFPHCLQSQIANLEGSLTGGTDVLAGAIPGGPNPVTNGDTADPNGRQAGMRDCAVTSFDAFERAATGGRVSAYYHDNVGNYSSNEPDIGYTPLMFLALAHQIPGASDPVSSGGTTSTSTTSTTSAPTSTATTTMSSTSGTDTTTTTTTRQRQRRHRRQRRRRRRTAGVSRPRRFAEASSAACAPPRPPSPAPRSYATVRSRLS